MVTFVLSAVYAAIAGFCYAHYVTFISPKTFDIFYSVQTVTMVAVGGMGNLWGRACRDGPPDVPARGPSQPRRRPRAPVRLILMSECLVFCPEGLISGLFSLPFVKKLKRFGKESAAGAGEPDRTFPRDSRTVDSAGPVSSGAPMQDAATSRQAVEGATPLESEAPLLCFRDVSVSFGGLQALHESGWAFPAGRIVALIGPNGAGKTTLLNATSGLIQPQRGKILLDGRNILGLAPFQIAARGIGRTFQAVQAYQKLTVLENVLLGYHLGGRSGLFGAYLHTPGERREERCLHEKAMDLLDDFGLAERAFRPAQRLSLFEQKLLELARTLALSPSVLLLDEPVGGLNPRESTLS